MSALGRVQLWRGAADEQQQAAPCPTSVLTEPHRVRLHSAGLHMGLRSPPVEGEHTVQNLVLHSGIMPTTHCMYVAKGLSLSIPSVSAGQNSHVLCESSQHAWACRQESHVGNTLLCFCFVQHS